MKEKIYFKIISILWIVWGAVHMFAGIITVKLTLSNETAKAIGGIADAVDPATLAMTYPDSLGAILGQHGFNLFWFGLITFICAFFIWKKNKHAVILAALVGGLADLGYFLFVDLGGYVNFMPGTFMTLVSGLAIILSIYVYRKRKNA